VKKPLLFVLLLAAVFWAFYEVNQAAVQRVVDSQCSTFYDRYGGLTVTCSLEVFTFLTAMTVLLLTSAAGVFITIWRRIERRVAG